MLSTTVNLDNNSFSDLVPLTIGMTCKYSGKEVYATSFSVSPITFL